MENMRLFLIMRSNYVLWFWGYLIWESLGTNHCDTFVKLDCTYSVQACKLQSECIVYFES